MQNCKVGPCPTAIFKLSGFYALSFRFQALGKKIRVHDTSQCLQSLNDLRSRSEKKGVTGLIDSSLADGRDTRPSPPGLGRVHSRQKTGICSMKAGQENNLLAPLEDFLQTIFGISHSAVADHVDTPC